MVPKVLAVKITEDTWPIAFACLSPSFGNRPPGQVIDKYWLVLNARSVNTVAAVFGGAKAMTFTNTYMTDREFKEKYDLVEYKDPNDYKPGEFLVVERK